ncbi:type II secretion system protein GspM [Massilia sp. R2A-15]|uniref:type II secretion system protein GspM n=1 Tax=Massilia sp. R2A-15 TaxID=3064278 RepID=UPI002733F5EE|nr:type II secretion system protein GspM [Massilia sp. R2A-15]WLI89270.1 type II secretion system protein GspM [Massilia sp. R2A-15]
MSAVSTVAQWRERATVAWMARTEQERKYLAIGFAVAVAAIVYALFIDPALSGRARLEKDLPVLRQQSAQLRAMALEAGELARAPQTQVAPMSQQALTASLASMSIVPQSVAMTGEFAKVQLNGVAFSSVVAWLDAQRRENRISVQDAVFAAQGALGQVDATLTLRQDAGAGPR